jgi:hypothetical protein
MTRHFSIPTVLRMTRASLLRTLFNRLGHSMPYIPWEDLRKLRIQPIIDAILTLPPAEQHALEAALHNIFDLACENGIRAIREAAVGTVGARIPSNVGGPYSASAWTWLEYPDVFDRAMLLFEVDHLTRWRKRKDVPKVTPSTAPEGLARLACVIGKILRRKEGRGQRCTVEHVRRADGTDCFLAYPDDFVHTLLMHDKEGNLEPRAIRQTFEIVFAYSQEDGTLELNAKVPTTLKSELEDAFCETLLGQRPDRRWRDPPYNLNVLKEGPDRLDTDPEDHVTPIVRRLRLAIPESRDTITLEAVGGAGPESIYRLLKQCLNRERLPLADLDVTSATIGLVLHPTDSRKPGRLTFDVSRPDICTLRNHRAERVALAQKYLKR